MKLWRYLLRQYVLMCAVSYISLLLFFSLFELAEFVRIVAQAQEKMAYVWEMTGWNLFVLSNEVGPLALMLSMVLFGANLSRRGEIVAIIGAGISPLRVLAPLLLVTALMCGGLLVIGDQLAPRGLARIETINVIVLHRNTKTTDFWGRERHWFRSSDKFVRLEARDDSAQTYIGMEILDIRDGHLQARYNSEKVLSLGTELLGQNVNIERYPLGEDTVERRHEDELLLPTARHFNAFLDMSSRPQRMDLTQLQTAATTRKRQGYDPTSYEAEYHARMWFPFTVLGLIFLASTFAFRVDVKRSFVRALGELIALTLAAFVVRQMFRSLSGSGLMHPFFGAAGPFVVYTLYGARRCQAVLGLAWRRRAR